MFLKTLRLWTGFCAMVLMLGPGCLLALLGMRNAAMSLWCSIGLWALGVTVRVSGPLPRGGSLVVANHASYLDILILGAVCPGSFVAKSEVRDWPLIGLAGRLAGVLFVNRERARSSSAALKLLERRLDKGERILLFPEGGINGKNGEVTPFRTMFFAGAASGGHPVAPTAIRYVYPVDPRVWAWTDDSNPLSHALKNLLPADYVRAAVHFGEPLGVGEGEGRKELALRANAEVKRLWEGLGAP